MRTKKQNWYNFNDSNRILQKNEKQMKNILYQPSKISIGNDSETKK